jgi:hypothetical protein
MEERVARLERGMEGSRARLQRLEDEMDRMTEYFGLQRGGPQRVSLWDGHEERLVINLREKLAPRDWRPEEEGRARTLIWW